MKPDLRASNPNNLEGGEQREEAKEYGLFMPKFVCDSPVNAIAI